MFKDEAVKKECIKDDHKGLQIVAVSLQDELNKDDNQNKYYCVKCLLEIIGNKKIIHYEEVKQKAKIVYQELLKNICQQNYKKLNHLKQLQASIQTIEEKFQRSIEILLNQIDSKLKTKQQQLEKVPEPTTLDESIILLSSCYEENGQLVIPFTENLKNTQTFFNYIKKSTQLISKSGQIFQEEKDIQTIDLEQSINIVFNDTQQKTPALFFTCEDHKIEIIMFNLNQTEFKQENHFLCVECAQDLFINGDKAVSNIISLKNAEQKWNDYIIEQIEKRSQRQSRLNQAIGLIIKFQEKQNQELNKMIQCLNEQLKIQPKEYEELMKLKNTCLLSQNKQNLLKIIKILGQKDQQTNKEELSNKEDSNFLQSIKEALEELIIENLLVENQIQWLQNYDKLPKKSNESDNEEVVEFLKKSTIQDLYLSLFENSFTFLILLKQEEHDLIQKGKLKKIIQSEQEMESYSILTQQYWYQQFQESQAKLERLMKVDEILTFQQQYEKFLQKEQETKKKLKDFETVNKILNTQLEKALLKIENMNKLIMMNKIQSQDEIISLRQIISFSELNWWQENIQLLSYEQAQKINKQIEERTKKRIKIKQLLYSSMKSGLNFDTLISNIENMSNLLMIFKSKTNQIFGGFSPCQWLLQSGIFQVDQQAQSFLFSSTKNEIYPIQNKSYAIYGSKSLLAFGSQDLQIKDDFQEGSSNLGLSYKCNQYSIPNAQLHLFGSPKPYIMGCEVIMITFV